MRNSAGHCLFTTGMMSVLCLPGLPHPLQAQPVRVTELMAENRSVFNDDDGDFSDWIEIFNPSSGPVTMGGWSLTDDPLQPKRWTFPDLVIPPRTYWMVFASGKNRSSLGAPLHTNFQLDSEDGEYLALADPQGSIVSEFQFPPLPADVAFGAGESAGYLLHPTPREPNKAPAAGLAPRPRFSQGSRTFTQGFSVELTLPEAPIALDIRYTVDGRPPTDQDPIYQGPITIYETTRLRARAFGPNGFVSPVASETYVKLGRGISGFSSNLPLVLVENFGQGRPPQDPKQSAFIAVFEPLQTNRASLRQPPHLATPVGIEVRGSSTAGRPKFSLGLEARDENDEDIDIEPLGMPSESDWVLWGPYNFDRALIRNPLIYQLSRDIGRYAVRTRFVEVFINVDGGSVGSEDYFGVYALMEKISRDADRVDVQELYVDHDREPAMTGGYMLKIDRPDPGDSGFGAANQQILYVEPKEREMERVERSAQRAYIQDYFEDFGTALEVSGSGRLNTHFSEYIDIPSAVDHHLLNVLAVNVDALRLSTYFQKRRNGKIVYGPIWDFDRSMESTDGRDDNPALWRGSRGEGTDFFNYPWWGDMFGDIDFFQHYIDRWQELRRGPFRLTHIHSLIDSMADTVREAQPRDLDRWGQTPRFGGYQGEIDHMKNWYGDRIQFIDSQFVDAPAITPDAGSVTPGTAVTLSSPGGGSIYYTLGGGDPRRAGGEVSSEAVPYSGPIRIERSVTLTARALNRNHTSLTGANNPPLSSPWSGPVTVRFATLPAPAPGDLLFTEIHYHPRPPSQEELRQDPEWTSEAFEFIEVENHSGRTVDLAGLRFRQGIEFDFARAAVMELSPAEKVLIVKNHDAFQARYGDTGRVAGVYSGQLSNGTEKVELVGAEDQVLLRVRYQDDWYPTTDGVGHSLVPSASALSSAPYIFNEGQTRWRPSAALHGSPGAADPESPLPTVWVNEILSNPGPGGVDTIELYNPAGTSVDISHWFLTDDSTRPKRFQIPPGTVIAPKGYLLIDATRFGSAEFAAMPFGLSSNGEEVYLFSGDQKGDLTGASFGFAFDAVAAGVSIGRYATSTGDFVFTPQAGLSLGELNAGPAIPAVVLNEIMYSPPAYGQGNNTLDEYLELWNRSDSPVVMAEYPTAGDGAGWRFSGAVDFEFVPGTELPPKTGLLVVPFDPVQNPARLARFRMVYSIPDSAAVSGPFIGNLDNDGESIRLERRQMDSENELSSWMTVEAVTYSPAHPWPGAADGSGASLQRVSADQFGNDPSNWMAGDPSPGGAFQPSETSDFDKDGLPDLWESAHSLNPNSPLFDHGSDGDPDHDGKSNLEEWLSGTHPRDPASRFEIRSVERNGTGTILSFEAVAGQGYTVQYRDQAAVGAWQVLKSFAPEEKARMVSVTDPSATNHQRYYRIQTQRP